MMRRESGRVTVVNSSMHPPMEDRFECESAVNGSDAHGGGIVDGTEDSVGDHRLSSTAEEDYSCASSEGVIGSRQSAITPSPRVA